MVKSELQISLDLVFSALGDPTRRAILRKLARGDFPVSELARPHEMSLPAISKHLKILERAGLVKRLRRGSTHMMQLRITQLQKASRWLDFYNAEGSWSRQLDSLEQLLQADPQATTPVEE